MTSEGNLYHDGDLFYLQVRWQCRRQLPDEDWVLCGWCGLFDLPRGIHAQNIDAVMLDDQADRLQTDHQSSVSNQERTWVLPRNLQRVWKARSVAGFGHPNRPVVNFLWFGWSMVLSYVYKQGSKSITVRVVGQGDKDGGRDLAMGSTVRKSRYGMSSSVTSAWRSTCFTTIR